jgi:hypothetical protein
MANADIIRRIQQVVDDYEEGSLLATSVEESLPPLVNCIEPLPHEKLHEINHLCGRLVTAHFTEDEPEFAHSESKSDVLRDLRLFLESLASNT